MSSSIVINRGECLDIDLLWTDENGDPIDITGRTFAVVDAHPEFTAAFTTTDATGGAVSMHADDTSNLRLGRVNSFRISMSLPDSCLDTTPPIWITVE